jgi:hypothetical protein
MNNAQQDRIIADAWMPEAVEVIRSIKQNIQDTDMYIKKAQTPRKATESWQRRHFNPVEFEPTMREDRSGLFIAAVVIVAIISAVVMTLDYWGK